MQKDDYRQLTVWRTTAAAASTTFTALIVCRVSCLCAACARECLGLLFHVGRHNHAVHKPRTNPGRRRYVYNTVCAQCAVVDYCVKAARLVRCASSDRHVSMVMLSEWVKVNNKRARINKVRGRQYSAPGSEASRWNKVR